ncbi:MAG TPA: hypothetical protein VMU14_06455 [Acidimicrobiales bacterium]|nr:hypothetical protein [Acidimicrobiales bacterium]
MQIYAPDGEVGAPPALRQPGRPVLRGLRIGVLDNAKPNARLVMERAASQIAARTGAVVALVTDKGPGHNAATPCSDEVLDRLQKEVDLVITGSAD